MVTSLEIGKHLARLREEAGFKQNELAQKVTWSPAVLSRVESGERPLTLDEIALIADAIGTEKAIEFGQTVRREWQDLERPQLGHSDEDLLWETELALQAINSLLDNPEIKNSFAARLREHKDEIFHVVRHIQSTEHSVAFIGDVGLGKSTAICRASGLEVSNEKSVPSSCVLEVGNGRITICEVHIVQGPQYGLLVEPFDDAEIRREVREFARSLKSPANDRDGSTNSTFGTSKEIERAIRNMSGLVQKRAEAGPDGKRIRPPDPAKKLAESSTDAEELLVDILTKMNLAIRTRRQLWYPPDQPRSDAPMWLKDNFRKLNNGRHPEFSIPKRIEVIVPEPILGEESLSIRLIDTRGVDRTLERSDIEGLLKEPNTVSVLCSAFNATPSLPVQELLKRAETGMIAGIQQKTAVLGLPRTGEALGMRYDDGESVETPDEGYDLKRDHAESTLKSIDLSRVRVDFFNALEDDTLRFRGFLLGLVQNLRDQHRCGLKELIHDTYSLVDDYERQQTLQIQKDAASLLATWRDDSRELDLAAIHQIERNLLIAIGTVHSSSVYASVRRQGEWYNLDYSHQLGVGARLAVANAVNRKLDELRAIADNLLKNEDFEDAFSLIRQARRIIDSGIEELLTKGQLAGMKVHVPYMKTDTWFWQLCDSEWGKGEGYYRGRVAGHHKNWFDESDHDFQGDIRDLVEKNWQATLNRLSAILDEVLRD